MAGAPGIITAGAFTTVTGGAPGDVAAGDGATGAGTPGGGSAEPAPLALTTRTSTGAVPASSMSSLAAAV